MLSPHRHATPVWIAGAALAGAALALAGCADRMQPAQRAISEIDTAINAASPQAGRYVPERLADVQRKLGELKMLFAEGDYDGVLARAPSAMTAAKSLAAAAAARRDEVNRALNVQWSALAAVVPEYEAAIQNRLEFLGKKVNQRSAGGVDVDAARSRLSEAASSWSKAQAAFATGNLPEAVSTARSLKGRLEELASAVKAQL